MDTEEMEMEEMEEMEEALLAEVSAAQDDMSAARLRLRQAIIACRQAQPPIQYRRITDETDLSMATVRHLALRADDWALRGRYYA